MNKITITLDSALVHEAIKEVKAIRKANGEPDLPNEIIFDGLMDWIKNMSEAMLRNPGHYAYGPEFTQYGNLDRRIELLATKDK